MIDCVFCKKIDAGETLLHSPFVASFVPLNPVTPGHRLFVPVAHREHRDGPEAAQVASLAVQVAHNYAQSLGEDFNLITSSGPAATQTISHIHIHYVPRRLGDGLTLPWTEQVKSND